MQKLILVILTLLSIPSFSIAQSDHPANVQSGEIAMEQDVHKGDSYEAQQEHALDFLKKVNASAAAGGSSTISAPEQSTLSYLNVAYLYCSITQGTCPQIIDAVLEADVINAHASNSASCPIMTEFWKLYVKNDMEQRHSHYVKTGFLTITDEFKKRSRPAYIKCKDTVAQILASPDKAQRYKANSETLVSLNKAVRITEELKARVPNLFSSLGAR